MATDIKVPGKKAKSYEHAFVRTMFFDKVETVTIDGNFHELSNNAKFETYNCKNALVEIYNYLDPENMSMQL